MGWKMSLEEDCFQSAVPLQSPQAEYAPSAKATYIDALDGPK